jgi:outer membrane protein TolC
MITVSSRAVAGACTGLATVAHARARLRATTLAVLALSGCAQFAVDERIDTVQTLMAQRIGNDASVASTAADPAATAARTRELLARPLAPDDAVQVALLNNAGLRASFAELGISAADVVQAGRMPNPRFSYGNTRGGDVSTIERTLMVSVLSMVGIPFAQQVAARRNQSTQLQVAADAVRLAADTRRAYFAAVAAQESVKYFEQVKMAAEASAELAARMARVGNLNKLARMREQVFQAEAVQQLARATLAASTARERLTRLLGVAGVDVDYRLPERLPALPDHPMAAPDAERMAMERRLEVLMARRSTEALAANLGLTKATRFINVFEAGYANESSTGEPVRNGYQIDIEVPLFDWGDAKLARAESIYMQSVHRLQSIALTAQSEVRESYQAYRTSYDIARHYRDNILPLRKDIAEENLLRYNGMLIGVFELLADAREHIAGVNGYIEASRDFWIAEADLQFALTGTSSEGRAAARTVTTNGATVSGAH